MFNIPAPDGYQGCMYWQDGTRSYMVCYRRIGDTWWTNTYAVGHAHMSESQLSDLGSEILQRYASQGIL